MTYRPVCLRQTSLQPRKWWNCRFSGMASDILLWGRIPSFQPLLPYLGKISTRKCNLEAPNDHTYLTFSGQASLLLRFRPMRGQFRSVTKCVLQGLPTDFMYPIADEKIVEKECLREKNCTWSVLTAASEILGEEAGVETDHQDMVFAGLLPSVQVQSPQEQVALAASPAHPEGLNALYASFFAGNLVEQVWHFTWPSAVALLHDSLLPVALVSFVSKLGIFFGGPWVGAFLDSHPRIFAFNALSIVQTVAQIISAAMIIYALRNGGAATCSASALLVQPWFLVLVLAGAVERLTGLASGVAFERDWVIMLAGANRPIALAHANSMLCRVDLFCEIAGTSLFGVLFSKYCPSTCLLLAAMIMIVSLPVLIFLVHCTNKLSEGALDQSKRCITCKVETPNAVTSEGSMQKFKLGWAQYLSQTTLPVSLAAVFLYFNIGLAPGSLMTSFLTQKGLNPSIIGAFSGMSAVMGFASTFLSAGLIQTCGVLKAGAIGLVLQASLLAVAVGVYWSNFLTHESSLIFFLILIVLSRLGHFTYDIVGGQILQTGVPPSEANVVGTTELSLASLAELLMLAVAIVANDVSHFGSLVILSMVAVCGAAWLYHRWMSRITEEQSRRFSLDWVTDGPNS